MQKIKLLLVEKDKNLSYRSAILKQARYYVSEAKSDEHILLQIQTDKPDILLLDEVLWKENTLELCKTLKHTPATQNLSIIICFSTKKRAKTRLPEFNSFTDGYLIQSSEDWEILSVVNNVEKVIRAEKLKAEQRLQYTSIANHYPDAMYAFDLEGNFTYANKAAAAISGYSQAELLALSFPQLIASDRLPECLAFFEKVKGGETLFYTSAIVTKEGNRIEINVTLVPIIEAERVVGIYGVSRDITTAVQHEQVTLAEHQLREVALSGASIEKSFSFMLEKFEKISSGMLCLILLVDSSGKRLIHPIAPSLPQAIREYFNGTHITLETTPCGAAAYSKELIYISNISDDKRWEQLKEIAIREQLQSCFCLPVVSPANEVMATLACFYKRQQEPRQQDMGLAQRMVKMMAILIEGDSAKKGILQKEQQLEEIHSLIPGVLYQFKIDSLGRISFPYFSARNNHIFGLPSQGEEDQAQLLSQSIHPEDRDAFWESVQHSAITLQPWLLDYRTIKSDSREIVWVRGHSIPKKHPDGSIIWHGILIDITDLKKAEEGLRIQSRAIENAAEGIIITDPYQEDNVIIFVNDKFLQDTLYTREEVMGRNCRFLQGKDTDREKVNQMRKAIKEGKTFTGEVLNYKKDGSPFWSFLVIAPVRDDKGRLTHFVGLMNDISERKEAEHKLLQQNEQLLKINSELDRFVYSVSHNLRAPLTSILGLISISKLTGKETERDTYLALMEKSIYKLDATIQEINEYAKNARLEIQIERINFHQMIAQVIEGLAYMEEASKIAIKVEADAAFEFYSDRRRVGVVLNNLISNAIKYHDRTKDDPWIRIKLQVYADSVNLSIRDNGIGIQQEHQEKIFNMFYRASTTSTGSGLGLYIVKENIKKMQGDIQLLSKPGKGSEFNITLPNLKNTIVDTSLL